MGIAQKLYDRRVRNVYRGVAGPSVRNLLHQEPTPVDLWIIHSQIMLGVHKKLGTKGTQHETAVNDAAYCELADQMGTTPARLDVWRGLAKETNGA